MPNAAVKSKPKPHRKTVPRWQRRKEARPAEIVAAGLEVFVERGEQMVAEYRGSAAELLGELLRKWWELIGETSLSGIPKLMMAEAGNFPVLARFYYDEVVTRGQRLMGGVLERGI